MILSWLLSGCPKRANTLGWIFFQIGLFFLPSSAFLSAIFLILSLCFGCFKRSISYWEDLWNWPLVIASILMLLGSFNAYSGWLAWAGLANWLPFFWLFWASQPYLMTGTARKRCCTALLLGSVPVLITGFGQLWFGWSGPWDAFNGLIVWFMAPGGSPTGRLSGLFDYANIAGAWLAVAWPFCLASLLQTSLNRSQRSIVFIFAIFLVSALILTDSRNAWGGLLIAIPLVLGSIHWPWLIPVLGIVLLLILFSVVSWIEPSMQDFARMIIPEWIWTRLTDIQYADLRPIEATRINQWQLAIKFIFERPLLGWGAASFSMLYPLYTGMWHGHAHNLPLELAVSNGLLVALLLVGFTLSLLIITFKKIFLYNSSSYTKESLDKALFDRAWWSSCLILVFLHASDMPFFDSRLNILGWIIISGMRCLAISQNSLLFID